jgi:hypothetical protein
MYIPSRGIFFGRRLLNKPLKRQSNYTHNFDPNDYLAAMKKF